MHSTCTALKSVKCQIYTKKYSLALRFLPTKFLAFDTEKNVGWPACLHEHGCYDFNTDVRSLVFTAWVFPAGTVVLLLDWSVFLLQCGIGTSI